jgi:uncharacterized repeat protein (TIGR03943 family)
VRAAGGAITVLAGTALLRLTLTGTYTRYVQRGMAPWLVLTGVVVVGLGITTLVRTWSGGDGHHDHDHGRERVGWLLLAPIAALLLVAPPALGSYGVDRGARLDVSAGPSTFEPLPANGRPVPLTLLEFNQRAVDHGGASFGDAPVQLTGFVAGASSADGPGRGQGDGFRLARYQIACCAADAAPVVVDVVGIRGDAPARDRWVTVTGTFSPAGGDIPRLGATSVVEIPEPDDPYE